MSDRDREPDPSSSAEDAELSKRLRNLGKRLGKSQVTRDRIASEQQAVPAQPGMGMALRLGADFVAGVIVGAALGWGFDRLLGTSPWGLIVFLLLGFAAGVLSVMRTAGLVKPRQGDDGSAAG